MKIIRSLGFNHIDIGFSHISIDPSLSSVQQGRNLRKKLKTESLTISDLFPSLPFETNDLDGNHRKQNSNFLEWMIGFAEGAECPGITLKPGIRQPVNEDEGWMVCLDVLGDYCALSQKAGLRLSVEPHVDSIIEHPQRARELVNDVEGLRLTLDYSHFVAMGFPIEEVKVLQPYVAHLHIRQARKGRVQSSAMTGVIPLIRILRELVGLGYSGVVSLEYQNSEWKNCNDIDVITETVTTLRELGVEI